MRTPQAGARGKAARLRAAWVALVAFFVACAPMRASAQAPTPLPAGYADDGTGAAPPDAAMQPAGDVDANPDEAALGDYADTDPSALTDFRQPLDPYGTWVDDPTYGTVWIPNTVVVGADFAPYQTAGHWALDEDEQWIWVSDYEWGYLPFHYGRWVWISGRGWAWIPGRAYAPAWVVWRTTDLGYIGWAPMPPAYCWYGGVAVGLTVFPTAAYVFVPTTYVFHHHVTRYVVRDRAEVHRIGTHSSEYRPSRATRSDRSGASARSSGGNRYRPASPSLADAKVPSSAAPKARIAPDPRAMSLSRSKASARASSISSSPSARGSGPAIRRRDPGSYQRGMSRSLPSSRGGSFDRAPRSAVPRAPSGFEGRDSRSRPVLRTPRSQPRAVLPPQSPAPVQRPSAPSPRFTPAPRPQVAPSPVAPPAIRRAPASAPVPQAPPVRRAPSGPSRARHR